MTIATVESWVEAIPLARPYLIAFRLVESIETVVVRLRDDKGNVGLGAASPEAHVTGESNAACQQALAADSLAWLRGADVRERARLERHLQQLTPTAPAARAAVDMALWDLLGHTLERPLVSLLGRAHDALPTSVTIGIKGTAEALAEADEHLGRGFRCLKIKVGRDPESDFDRLRTLRAHVGPEIRLRVDANQGYDLRSTVRLLALADTLDLELVEQPVPVRATDELRRLPQRDRDRVYLDESVLGPANALTWTNPPRPCGGFNVKLMKCGGPTAALRMATIAEAAQLGLMWGCMDESRIGIAAALHTALACPATRFLDLDGSFDLARDVAEGGFAIAEGGVLRPLSDRAGLGVRLSGDPSRPRV